MKKILIILIVIIFTSCTVKIDPEKFFINEDFILLKKYEKEVVINGYTRNIKTWEIIKYEGDSMYVGIIDNRDSYTGSCGSGILTDELWKKKKVGDILHFDYINKERFLNRNVEIYTTTTSTPLYSDTLTINVDKPVELQLGGELTTEKVNVINMNKLEIERRILDLQREIESLEREIESLKLEL